MTRSSADTAHAIPGRRAVQEALAARRKLREVLVEERAASEGLAQAAAAAGVPVRQTTRAEIDGVCHGVVHQGVAAVAPPFAYRRVDDVAEGLVVLLDGVTDPQNLGAIARSAEAAGANALVLPRRRSAHVTPAAEKAAAGAFSWLDVAMAPNAADALQRLARGGLWSVGLDGDADEPLWAQPLLDGPVVLVIGAEGAGLSRLTAERCDALVAIPLHGHVGSLNASAAAAVALFEVRRRREQRQ